MQSMSSERTRIRSQWSQPLVVVSSAWWAHRIEYVRIENNNARLGKLEALWRRTGSVVSPRLEIRKGGRSLRIVVERGNAGDAGVLVEQGCRLFKEIEQGRRELQIVFENDDVAVATLLEQLR